MNPAPGPLTPGSLPVTSGDNSHTVKKTSGDNTFKNVLFFRFSLFYRLPLAEYENRGFFFSSLSFNLASTFLRQVPDWMYMQPWNSYLIFENSIFTPTWGKAISDSCYLPICLISPTPNSHPQHPPLCLILQVFFSFSVFCSFIYLLSLIYLWFLPTTIFSSSCSPPWTKFVSFWFSHGY